MSIETDIYDFETAIGGPIQDVLDEVDLNTLGISDPKKFQEDRPRCEVIIGVGAAGDQLYPEAGQEATPGSLRSMTYTGYCSINVITGFVKSDNDDEWMELHKQYRARIRKVCDVMKRSVNGTRLTYHKLQSFKPAGCSYDYADDKGYLKTMMRYEIKFSIQNNAFSNLS